MEDSHEKLSELFRQEGSAESFQKPAQFFHCKLTTVGNAAANGEWRWRKARR
jgi:hypothetical protein